MAHLGFNCRVRIKIRVSICSHESVIESFSKDESWSNIKTRIRMNAGVRI